MLLQFHFHIKCSCTALFYINLSFVYLCSEFFFDKAAKILAICLVNRSRSIYHPKIVPLSALKDCIPMK